jgi:putative transposase
MTQTVSVSCKLQVPVELRPEIDATLQAFGDACNQILQVSKRERVKNTTKLHYLTYYTVKASTGLKANHVCQAIRRVIGAVTGQKQVHQFRPTSMNLDARTFSYREKTQQVGITLMNRRVWLPLSIGNYQIGLLKGQSPTSAVLCKRKNGDYYIQIQVDIPTQPPGKTPKVIGVDVGQRDIAHTSTGKSWSGGQIQATREKRVKITASIQSKGTKGAKRLLKRLSGRDRRFQKWVNHNISKQLVGEAKQLNAAIAFEDLTGIRQRAKVRKSQRRNLHSWACYQLKQFTAYKLAIAGLPMLNIPAPYTSQTHYVCLRIGQRKGKDFWCECCQKHEDADFNAAKVIELWGRTVIRPGHSELFCSLEQMVLG